MNRFTKKQLLIGGIILLVVINLAALGTLLYNNYEKQSKIPPPPPRRYEKKRNIRECESNQDRFAPFNKKRLNLDQEQFETFKELRRESQMEQTKIRKKIENRTEEMMKELSSEHPDEKKLDTINKEIGELHMELNRITIQHFSNIKKELNPNQKEELNKLIYKMSEHRKHHMQERRRVHK